MNKSSDSGHVTPPAPHRRDHEPPSAIAKLGWRYHHLGVPTQIPRSGEQYLAPYKFYVSGFSSSPYGIEWMRFEPDCPLHEIIKTVPHVAFEVDDLDAALEGEEILYPPGSPSEGVRAAMILHDGAPVELIAFDKSVLESAGEITLRTELHPGDVGWIVGTHGSLYAREWGFDPSFEAYVAGPLAACVRAGSTRDRIWLAERDGRRIGCVAIVAASLEQAQFRWFLVTPEARGCGLGRRLLGEAIDFCRRSGYRSIMLWTVSSLLVAAHLYKAFGFRKVQELPGRQWGAEVIEEQYELPLA
jgi:GNAT superfamily N-acetyltransferase